MKRILLGFIIISSLVVGEEKSQESSTPTSTSLSFVRAFMPSATVGEGKTSLQVPMIIPPSITSGAIDSVTASHGKR